MKQNRSDVASNVLKSPHENEGQRKTDEVKTVKANDQVAGVHKDAKESVSLEEVQFPNIKTLKEQVKEDPHNTPEELIQFSVQLASQTNVALKSEDLSRTFVQKLENCV